MKNKSNLLRYLSIIWYLLMFGILAVFLWQHIDCLLDSDMSSELVLSKLLSEENGILSKNWYYSTELRVLNTQIFFMPLFKISSDWHFVRVAGSILMLIVMSLGLYYMLEQMKCSSVFPIAAAFLIMPLSDGCFERFLKAPHYVPCISISFYLMGMVFQYARASKRKHRTILLICIGILSLFSGMNGPRQLMVLQMPLVLAVFFLGVLEYKREKTKNIVSLYLCPSIVSLAGAAAGYLVNTKILTRIYNFKTWEDMEFTYFKPDSFMSVINGFLQSYGYTSGRVLSFALIQNIFSIALFLATIYCIVLSIRQKYEDKDKELLMLSGLYLSAVVLYIGLYAFTSLVYDYRYNLPIIVFSIPIIAYSIKQRISDRKVKYIVCLLLILCASLCSCFKYREYFKQDKTEELRQVVDYLTENEYLNGYGTFWNGNVLTELSDGQIEVWTWNIGETIGNLLDINWSYNWLQSTEHNGKKPDGRVFVLLDNGELEQCQFNQFLYKAAPAYSTENYIVFGFENYEALTRALTNYSSDFSSGQWTVQGQKEDELCEILPGEILCGPGITIYTGKYEISFEGENLDMADFECVYDSGEESVEIYNLRKDKTKVVYNICLDDTALYVETRVKNNSDSPVILKNMTIQKLAE